MDVAAATLVLGILAIRLRTAEWVSLVSAGGTMIGPPALSALLVLALQDAIGAVVGTASVFGLVLLAIGIASLREKARRGLVLSLGIAAGTGVLLRMGALSPWFAASAWSLGVPAAWAVAGRMSEGGRRHASALAGCGAVALGGYFLAQSYVAGTGTAAGEGVQFPPAPSGLGGAIVLVALLLAAGCGYNLQKLQSRE